MVQGPGAARNREAGKPIYTGSFHIKDNCPSPRSAHASTYEASPDNLGYMQRTWIALGALAGLTAVAMAALAAHGLESLPPAALQMVRNAIQMHGWHALALLACGLWAPRGGRLVDCAAAAFAIGLVLFCGAVYALALDGVRLPMIAPIGGTLLMLGWLLLLVSTVTAALYH
jgi:uncharacterized membrane protein YgdD (TMEM256/DUF423 family)